MLTVERIKSLAGQWGTIIYRTFVGILLVLIFKAIPIFIYDAAKWQKDMEDRTLTSVEMRIDLERHMASWTPVRQEKAFERLTNTETAIKALKKADSLSTEDRLEIRQILLRIENLIKKQ